MDHCSSMMKNSKIGGSGWRQIRKAGTDWDHRVRSLSTGRLAGLLQRPGWCHQGPAGCLSGPWSRAGSCLLRLTNRLSIPRPCRKRIRERPLAQWEVGKQQVSLVYLDPIEPSKRKILSKANLTLSEQ